MDSSTTLMGSSQDRTQGRVGAEGRGQSSSAAKAFVTLAGLIVWLLPKNSMWLCDSMVGVSIYGLTQRSRQQDISAAGMFRLEEIGSSSE